jgi:hypothetical protein
MILLLEYGMTKYDFENKEIPLVMIGHNKDFFNQKNFKKFLSIVKKKYHNSVRFNTFFGYSNFLNGEKLCER